MQGARKNAARKIRTASGRSGHWHEVVAALLENPMPVVIQNGAPRVERA